MPLIELFTDRGSVKVTADLFGCFAVHPTLGGLVGQFQLTHVPTGFAYLERVTYEQAVAAAAEINAGKIDWATVTSSDDLTAAQKAQGRVIREKYPSDPVVHIQRRNGR